MRVQADHRAVASGEVADEVFDLIGIDIGGRRLDRRGQVEDDRVFGGGRQHLHHCFADLEAEIEFGSREGFGAVLEMPRGIGLLGRFVAHDLGAMHCNVADLLLAHPEHHFAPGGADGIVEMDDRLLGSCKAGKAGPDQVFTALSEDLHQHVVGYAPVANQARDEVKLGGTGAGETDFDFLHPDFDEEVEEAPLLVRIHRIDNCLVAIAQIGRQPARRRGDGARGPLAFGKRYLREGRIFDARVAEHGHRGNSVSAKV